MRLRRLMLAAALAVSVLAAPLAARTLDVGPDAALHSLADAVAAAKAGDTIHLAAGSYYECATITVRDLVLEGAGPDTVLTDKPCGGKAILVVQADNLTVRDLTLARARVPDMNGAGIRLEAQGLVLDRVTFENNEAGVLAGQPGPGTILIRDCSFHGGGVAGERPGVALQVGDVARLVVERTAFAGIKGGQISSGAGSTLLTGNRIETGIEPGAGAAILLVDGALSMRDNVIAVGPNAPPRNAAVIATGGTVEMRSTRLENSTGQGLRLLLDWTHGDPLLVANRVPPGDAEVSSEGVWRHRAGGVARDAMGEARAAARTAKQALQRIVGR